MNWVYKYILSVICIVMLCGIVNILLPTDKNSLMKLVTGLIVTAVVVSPILHTKTINLDGLFSEFAGNKELAVAEGTMAARHVSNQFIKTKSETYILNKAEEMGAHINVEVVLSDADIPVPAEVSVKGMESPYVKEQLSACIQNELGIVKDDQTWIS